MPSLLAAAAENPLVKQVPRAQIMAEAAEAAEDSDDSEVAQFGEVRGVVVCRNRRCCVVAACCCSDAVPAAWVRVAGVRAGRRRVPSADRGFG